MSSLKVLDTVVRSPFKIVSKRLVALTLLSGACALTVAVGAESGDTKELPKASGRGRAMAAKRSAKAGKKQESYGSDTITEREHWDAAGMLIDLRIAGKITKEEATKRAIASRKRMRLGKPGLTEEDYNSKFAAIQKRLDAGTISADKAHQERIALRGKAFIFRIFRVSNPKLQRYCQYEKTVHDGILVGKITEEKAEETLGKVRAQIWPKGKDAYKAYKLERQN